MATKENLEFHKLLAKASKNQVLVIIMELLAVALGHLLSRRPPDLETTGSAIQFHEDILKAIVKKDRGRAQQSLEDHLKEVENQLNALSRTHETGVINEI